MESKYSEQDREGYYVKYPHIPCLDSCPDLLSSNEIYLFEKLDGGNCQIRKIQGRVRVGSRSKFLEGKSAEKVSWFGDFLRWVSQRKNFYGLDERHVIFCEWLSFHNIKYEKENMNKPYFLDLYDLAEKRFVPYDHAVSVLEESIEISDVLGLLEILSKGRFDLSEIERVLKAGSDYRYGSKEGVVIKDYDKQIFAKVLHPEFAESVDDKRLPNVQKYVTLTRLRKTYFTITEEGDTPDFEKVAKRVMVDVQRENGVSLNKRELRKRVKSFLLRQA